MEFEEWMDRAPSPALKELAGGGEAMRPLYKADVVEFILSHPDALARARESWRIAERAREYRESVDPRAARALRMRYGLVD